MDRVPVSPTIFGVMLFESAINVRGQTDVKFGIKISQNVNAINPPTSKKKLVAGARFELATFRL
jgi:hypothetical protein